MTTRCASRFQYSDFCACLLNRAFAIPPCYQTLATLKVEFNLYDTDHSGAIDVHELEVALKTLGVWKSAEHMQKLFSELDVDGSGEIEFYEFCQMIHKIGQQAGGASLDFAAIHAKQKAVVAAQKEGLCTLTFVADVSLCSCCRY